MSKDYTYRVRGNRVGVLLLHGLCGTPTEMRFVATGIARAGYSVTCPQLAGHCGSIADLAASTWGDWYASAEAALDEMRETCDTVIVGGLSTGAVLALLLAARRPKDVQGTLLLAPTLWLNGWLIPWYARLFKIVFFRRMADLFDFPDLHPHGIKDERIRDFIRNALASGDSAIAGLPATPGSSVLEHRRLVNATLAELDRIRQPAMIVHPREDDYADLDNAWYLQRHLKGMVDMVVLDDSYHIVTVDRQRHVVVERAQQFVGNVVRALEEQAAKTQTREAARRAA